METRTVEYEDVQLLNGTTDHRAARIVFTRTETPMYLDDAPLSPVKPVHVYLTETFARERARSVELNKLPNVPDPNDEEIAIVRRLVKRMVRELLYGDRDEEGPSSWCTLKRDNLVIVNRWEAKALSMRAMVTVHPLDAETSTCAFEVMPWGYLTAMDTKATKEARRLLVLAMTRLRLARIVRRNIAAIKACLWHPEGRLAKRHRDSAYQ